MATLLHYATRYQPAEYAPDLNCGTCNDGIWPGDQRFERTTRVLYGQRLRFAHTATICATCCSICEYCGERLDDEMSARFGTPVTVREWESDRLAEAHAWCAGDHLLQVWSGEQFVYANETAREGIEQIVYRAFPVERLSA